VTVLLALRILAGLKLLMSTGCRVIFYAQSSRFCVVVITTTTSGSVAPSSGGESKPKSTGGMSFGKGVYEALNKQLEILINEGITVNVNYTDGGLNGQPNKSINVSADGDDAEKLAELLNLAGVQTTSHEEPSAEVVDENKPDWPTNPEYSDDALQYSGGLNKPKETGQSTIPVLASQIRRQMDENVNLERTLFSLYKKFKGV